MVGMIFVVYKYICVSYLSFFSIKGLIVTLRRVKVL